ncbi:MAG: hypothetical protein ACRCZQ_11710 [Bacteroidales bacterium]
MTTSAVYMTVFSQNLPSPVISLKQTLIIKSLKVTATRIYRHPAVTFTVTHKQLNIKRLQQKVTGDGKIDKKKELTEDNPSGALFPFTLINVSFTRSNNK